MARRTAVLVMALLLAPLSPAAAQTAPAAPAAPGAPPSGNPTNPGDFAANPHPGMPWFGPGTPYGQFVRWLWVPARVFSVNGWPVEQPGYWVAETTSGYYYIGHWELAQGPAGELTWRMVPRRFVPRTAFVPPR
jgi:hypothetical protein